MAGNNPIYYWDTCIFLAWLKNETNRKPGEMEGIHDCLERVKKRQISIMTSVITYTEITTLKIPAGVETMLEEVMQRPNCAKIGVDMRVAKLARDLRAPLKIQTPSRCCVAPKILTLTYQTYAAR